MRSRSAHSTAVLNLLHSATVTLASAGRGTRLKRKSTAAALESWTIESSSSRRRQPNSERRTRSSTHTVNLPLLPADTANDAYGPQNRAEKTSLGPESSFSLNLYVQSLRPAHQVRLMYGILKKGRTVTVRGESRGGRPRDRRHCLALAGCTQHRRMMRPRPTRRKDTPPDSCPPPPLRLGALSVLMLIVLATTAPVMSSGLDNGLARTPPMGYNT
jgi:hypothetical protein